MFIKSGQSQQWLHPITLKSNVDLLLHRSQPDSDVRWWGRSPVDAQERGGSNTFTVKKLNKINFCWVVGVSLILDPIPAKEKTPQNWTSLLLLSSISPSLPLLWSSSFCLGPALFSFHYYSHANSGFFNSLLHLTRLWMSQCSHFIIFTPHSTQSRSTLAARCQQLTQEAEFTPLNPATVTCRRTHFWKFSTCWEFFRFHFICFSHCCTRMRWLLLITVLIFCCWIFHPDILKETLWENSM